MKHNFQNLSFNTQILEIQPCRNFMGWRSHLWVPFLYGSLIIFSTMQINQTAPMLEPWLTMTIQLFFFFFWQSFFLLSPSLKYSYVSWFLAPSFSLCEYLFGVSIQPERDSCWGTKTPASHARVEKYIIVHCLVNTDIGWHMIGYTQSSTGLKFD